MSVIRIATRYAKSLLDLAIEQNKLERIKEDVDSFVRVTKHREFYLMLKSPIINKDKKKAVLHSIFDGNYDELTLKFLEILVRKHREAYLPEIAESFLDQYKHYMHITTVNLTTATKLSDAALESIKNKLMESVLTDDKVEINTSVDPKLVGGFVLEFDGKQYDASVARKLEVLRKELFGDNLYVSQIIAR